MILQQPTTTEPSIPPIAPIDPKQIVEHGNSPTAIILAIAILLAVFLGSMTGLVKAIALVILIIGHKMDPVITKYSSALGEDDSDDEDPIVPTNLRFDSK